MPRKPVPIAAEVLRQLLHGYYERNESIDDLIAQLHLNLKRTKVYDLLKHAKETGLVETMVLPGPEPTEELTAAVRHRFGLKRVVLVEGPTDDREFNRTGSPYGAYVRKKLGAATAAFFTECNLQNESQVVVGGGRTLLEFAQRAVLQKEIRIVVRPSAVRGHYRSIRVPEPSMVAQLLEARLGEHGVVSICPSVLPGKAKHADVRKRPEVVMAFGTDARNTGATKPKLVLARVDLSRWLDDRRGAPPTPFEQVVAEAIYYRKEYQKLGPQDSARVLAPINEESYTEALKTLREDYKVFASLFWHGLDRDGEVIEETTELLEDTCLRIHPKTIRAWRQTGDTTSVVIANGTRGGPVLKAALHGGYFDVLIADVAIGIQLLLPTETPDAFRHVPKVEDVSEGQGTGARSKTRRQPAGRRNLKRKS